MKTKLGVIHPGGVKAKHRHRGPSDQKRRAARMAARPVSIPIKPKNIKVTPLDDKGESKGKTVRMWTRAELEGLKKDELRDIAHERGLKTTTKFLKHSLVDLILGS